MSETPDSISQEPVNILFNPSSIPKKDVWDVDLVQIIDLLVRILAKSQKVDLKVAGMAALSSSLIYRMKVESMFAFQRAAMEKKPMTQRKDLDIQLLNIPYRHESTSPVSLDDLISMLQNLLGTLANPASRKKRGVQIEAAEPPNFENVFISLEKIIGRYEDIVMKKVSVTGEGMLHDIIASLNEMDSIRCFFAILFLARDGRVDLEQVDDDIRITMLPEQAGGGQAPGESDGKD